MHDVIMRSSPADRSRQCLPLKAELREVPISRPVMTCRQKTPPIYSATPSVTITYWTGCSAAGDVICRRQAVGQLRVTVTATGGSRNQRHDPAESALDHPQRLFCGFFVCRFAISVLCLQTAVSPTFGRCVAACGFAFQTDQFAGHLTAS